MEKSMDVDLKRALFALWARAWIVVLAGVILGVAAFSYARFFKTPIYSSSIKIYVNNNNAESQ